MAAVSERALIILAPADGLFAHDDIEIAFYRDATSH
jgi:hypothetical protein